MKFFSRKIERIKEDLERVKDWSPLQEKLVTDELDLEQSEKYTFNKIVIKFKKDQKHFQRRDKVFKKLKGLKKAQGILEKRLQAVEKEFEEYRGNSDRWPLPKFKMATPLWDKKPRLKVKKSGQASEIIEFILLGEIRGAVGKNPSGNDFLRKSWGSKEDYWFHLDGHPSAHVVLKLKSLGQLDSHAYNAIGSLLSTRSGLEIREIPLLYTQVKNLKGVKGSPGSVTFKKERRLRAEFATNWMEILALV
ncbi:MAG: DUF814 domain-containing protein [Halobacteriovoraceae bacterium]|nr:DUF814 domain-containing protein [Halobacteriovoraceae bacterium]